MAWIASVLGIVYFAGLLISLITVFARAREVYAYRRVKAGLVAIGFSLVWPVILILGIANRGSK